MRCRPIFARSSKSISSSVFFISFEMGIPAKKIKIVFNRVEYDEIDELDAFASLIGFHSTHPIIDYTEFHFLFSLRLSFHALPPYFCEII
jgi:hypothetical protein